MGMLNEHPYTRVEFDWLACDLDGYIAYLSSAGAGPVPEAAVENSDFLEGVLDLIRELPRSGAAILMGETSKPPDWKDAAERGFFSYDWSYAHHRYELVARPSSPVRLDKLPQPKLREAAAHVRLHAHFSEVDHISPDVELT